LEIAKKICNDELAITIFAFNMKAPINIPFTNQSHTLYRKTAQKQVEATLNCAIRVTTYEAHSPV
jgi:hypothetical protein